MLLYNITVSIDNTVAQDWLAWMKEHHIPEVLAATYVVRYVIARMLTEEADTGGETYAVQYSCRNMADYEEYQQDYAPALDAKMACRYPNQYVTFESLLEIVD
jgi:hypothetical protein